MLLFVHNLLDRYLNSAYNSIAVTTSIDYEGVVTANNLHSELVLHYLYRVDLRCDDRIPDNNRVGNNRVHDSYRRRR